MQLQFNSIHLKLRPEDIKCLVSREVKCLPSMQCIVVFYYKRGMLLLYQRGLWVRGLCCGERWTVVVAEAGIAGLCRDLVVIIVRARKDPHGFRDPMNKVFNSFKTCAICFASSFQIRLFLMKIAFQNGGRSIPKARGCRITFKIIIFKRNQQ